MVIKYHSHSGLTDLKVFKVLKDLKDFKEAKTCKQISFFNGGRIRSL